MGGGYTLEELQIIIDKWDKFSEKNNYYNLREYWNKKYKNDEFDREFILETALLLKMCSNSMVRFNQSNEFNQGFRGLGKKDEFFTESMKDLIVDNLNLLYQELNNRNYIFSNEDAVDIKYNDNDLLILDPPYILRQDMYSMDFTKSHDSYFLDLINENKIDFVYFNYLERDGIVHEKLKDIIDKNNFRVIELSDKTKSGQGASSVKDIKEVIITNIKYEWN